MNRLLILGLAFILSSCSTIYGEHWKTTEQINTAKIEFRRSEFNKINQLLLNNQVQTDLWNEIEAAGNENLSTLKVSQCTLYPSINELYVAVCHALVELKSDSSKQAFWVLLLKPPIEEATWSFRLLWPAR